MNILGTLVDPTVPAHRRLLRWMLVALLLAACGVRVWLVFQHNPMDHLWSDPGRHWNHGVRPLDTAPMSAIDAVVYQIYVGALAKLTVGQPRWSPTGRRCCRSPAPGCGTASFANCCPAATGRWLAGCC